MAWPAQSAVLAGKSIYGNPRGKTGTAASLTWEAGNLVKVSAPWPMTMGDIKITSFRMHKHCAPSLLRVFAALKYVARNDYDLLTEWGVTRFGDGYNYRLMRGGTKLSMHSYGAAIDLDPQNNGLGDSTPRFAKYPAVLRAFADEGWTWGGTWSRADGMHWQAANI